MSSLTMNGGATGSPRSLSESEESFVVLSPSLAPDNMENIMSINASMVNSTVASSMPEVSKEVTIWIWLINLRLSVIWVNLYNTKLEFFVSLNKKITVHDRLLYSGKSNNYYLNMSFLRNNMYI